MLSAVRVCQLVMTLWLLGPLQVQAAWECMFKPEDDIIINPQYVQIIGASGNLHIEPDGEIKRNGQRLNTPSTVQQQAEKFQADLRRDLPWVEQGMKTHIENARIAMDNVLVQQMGSTTSLRNNLAILDQQLTQQVNSILEKNHDGYIFHHQKVAQVEREVQALIGQTMGQIVKDSINESGAELSLKSLEPSSSNALQGLFLNLGRLQQSLQNEWSSQDDILASFGQEACQRVIALDKQRKALIDALPA